MLERFGHPTLHPGDGSIESFLRGIEFVQDQQRLATFFLEGHRGDGTVIDGLGPNGVAARVIDTTNQIVRLQTGYLYHYAFVMLIGIAALVTWMMLGSSF